MKTIFITCLVFFCTVASAQTIYIGTVKPSEKSADLIARTKQGDSIIFRITGKYESRFTFDTRNFELRNTRTGIDITEGTGFLKLTSSKKELTASNGKTFRYTNVKYWYTCLTDKDTDRELVKGNYEFQGDKVKITVWIDDASHNPQLIAIVIDKLIRQASRIQESNEDLLTTISALPVTTSK